MVKLFSLVGEVTAAGLDVTKKELTALDKEARKVQRQFNKVGKATEALGRTMSKFVTGPLLGAVAASLLAADATGKYADKMLDLEQITGLSTDSLQEYEQVAREAGVSFEGLTGTIAKLTNQIPDIAKGTGPAAEAMEALGVNVFDASGDVRDMNELFPSLINKLRGVENITTRNALTQDIFGRSLQDIAPVIGLTAKQLDDARQKAHDLGLVMDGDALKAANEYRIAIDTLKAQFGVLARELASAIIPILQDTLIPLFQDKIVPAFRKVIGWIASMVEGFKKLDKPMQSTILTWVGMAAALGPVLTVVGKLVSVMGLMIPLFAKLVTGQLTLNAAMAANPVGLIITGIAVLIAVGVLLWKNWDLIAQKSIDMWNVITHAFQQSISWTKKQVLDFVRIYLEAIQGVTKHIPGINKLVDKSIAKLQDLADQEDANISTRRQLRKVTLAQRDAERALAKQVAEAEEIAKDSNETKKKKIKLLQVESEETKKLQQRIAELAKERATIEAGAEDRLLSAILTKGQMLDMQETRELDAAKRVGASTADIEQFYALERLKLAQEESDAKLDIAEGEAEKKTRIRQNTVQAAIGAINQVFDIFMQANQNELAALDNKLEKDKKRAKSTITNETKLNARLAALDEAADAKKKELMREQARIQKAAAIFSIIVGTAQAAVQTFAALGWPAGIVGAAVVAALGTVQAVLVAAEPIPFAQGGLVKGGGRGVVAQVGEATQDELVLPLKTGVGMFVDALRERAGSFGMGGGGALAGAGGGDVTEFHIHAGTIIADQFSVNEFIRTIDTGLRLEQKRRGAA